MGKKIFSFDLRSLALFRICLALFIIFDLISRASDIRDHYSDLGIFPRTLSVQYMYHWNFSLHMISGREEVQYALFIINGLCAFALFLGYTTRLATFLCWLFLLSLHTCNPLVTLTSDYFIRLILFWSMFLPLGAYYSIDSAVNSSSNENGKKSISAISTASYSLQIIFIYLFSSVSRLSTEHRDFISSLINLSSLSSIFPKAETIATMQILVFELIIPLLLLVPFHTDKIKISVLAAFFGLYIGLGFFPFHNMIAFIPFLPAFIWNKTSLEKILMLDYIEKLGIALQKKYPSVFITNTSQHKTVLHLLPALILGYTLYWNISILDTSGKPYYKFPEKLLWIGNLAGINYPWIKFSTTSLLNEKKQTKDKWFVLRGVLKDGTEINLLREGEKLSWNKPSKENDIYKNVRWKQAIFNIFTEQYYKVCQPYYAYHLCMKWNYNHPSEKNLTDIEFFENEVSKDKILLYSYQCAGEIKAVEDKIKEIESKYSENDVTFINELYNLAAGYYRAGKYSDAEQIYKSISKKEEELYGENSKYLVNCLEILATIYKLQGKELEAEKVSERVKKITNE